MYVRQRGLTRYYRRSTGRKIETDVSTSIFLIEQDTIDLSEKAITIKGEFRRERLLIAEEKSFCDGIASFFGF